MSKEHIIYEDLEFELNNTLRIIHNVPVTKRKDHPDSYEMDIALKLVMIRDLMQLNEVPSEVDFNWVKNFKF